MNTSNLIINIKLSYLTNAELDETSLRLVPVFNTIITVEPLPPFVADFAQKTSAYSAAIKQQQVSVLTRDIQLLDRNRDRALTELFHDVANETLSKDPATRDAAYALDAILRTYGNPARRPMDDQTNIVRDICNRLTDSSQAANLTKLPTAKALTAKLQTLNNQFSDLYTQRIAEHDHKETGIVQRLRKELEPSLQQLITKTNAYIHLYGDTALAPAVASINSILTDAKHLINRRAGQRHHDGGEGPAPACETCGQPQPAEPQE